MRICARTRSPLPTLSLLAAIFTGLFRVHLRHGTALNFHCL